MKRAWVVSLCTCWWVVISSLGDACAAGADKSSYVGVGAGLTAPGDLESQDRNQHKSLPDIDLSNEYWLAARVGHTPRLTHGASPIVIELEGSMITQTSADTARYLDSPFGSKVAFDADVSVKSIMLNFLLRYPHGRIHPYGGFGLGWVWFDLEDVRFLLDRGFTWPETGTRSNNKGDLDDDVFGYQFILGTIFDLTDTLSLDFGYRYFRTEPEFKFKGVAYDKFEAPIVLDVKMTYATHIFGVGLTYWF